MGGDITRGFYGYLIAALPSPLGRMMMLNDLVEQSLFHERERASLCASAPPLPKRVA